MLVYLFLNECVLSTPDGAYLNTRFSIAPGPLYSRSYRSDDRATSVTPANSINEGVMSVIMHSISQCTVVMGSLLELSVIIRKLVPCF